MMPGTVVTSEMVNKVHNIVMTDRRVTERYNYNQYSCISQESIHSILMEDGDLAMRKLSITGYQDF